jgi:hypothetical protein
MIAQSIAVIGKHLICGGKNLIFDRKISPQKGCGNNGSIGWTAVAQK